MRRRSKSAPLFSAAMARVARVDACAASRSERTRTRFASVSRCRMAIRSARLAARSSMSVSPDNAGILYPISDGEIDGVCVAGGHVGGRQGERVLRRAHAAKIDERAAGV